MLLSEIPFYDQATQRRMVQKRLEYLARNRELTEEKIIALRERYADKPRLRPARRYLKRLLALWRAGVFRPQDAARRNWERLEERAASAWYDSEGHLIPRHLQEEITAEKVAARPQPKSERPYCAAKRRDGQPCQARALPGDTLCFRHRQKAAN